jgi:triacylglycerol lipase
MFAKRNPPKPSLRLVAHPESDTEYIHFQPQMEDGSRHRAADLLPFDAAAQEFSPVNAWWLADAALLSYWNPDIATDRFREQAGLDSEFLMAGGTQAYVTWNSTAVIVAFRGTQPNEESDVWSDVDYRRVPWENGGHVHEGFKAALDVIWGQLASRLRGLPGRSVWLCGHSLGAAIATLAADRVGAPAGVYTLGSPRVGDAAFVDAFNSRHDGRVFRYVNNHDVVTHVPPLQWRFSHVDREQHFNEDGEMIAGTAQHHSVLDASIRHVSEGVDLIVSGASLVPPPVIDHTPRRYTTFVWNAFVKEFVTV